MSRTSMLGRCRARVVCVAASLVAGVVVGASAQPVEALRTRTLAASCAACHGTDGAAVEGSGMPVLRGLERDYLLAQLVAFRDGTRPATVMHQIARGYTPEQMERLADYFAALPRPQP